MVSDSSSYTLKNGGNDSFYKDQKFDFDRSNSNDGPISEFPNMDDMDSMDAMVIIVDAASIGKIRERHEQVRKSFDKKPIAIYSIVAVTIELGDLGQNTKSFLRLPSTQTNYERDIEVSGEGAIRLLSHIF